MSARTRYLGGGCIGGLRLPLCQVAAGCCDHPVAAPNPSGVKWLILPQKLPKVSKLRGVHRLGRPQNGPRKGPWLAWA